MAMSAYLNIPDPRYEISAEEAEKLPATQNRNSLRQYRTEKMRNKGKCGKI